MAVGEGVGCSGRLELEDLLVASMGPLVEKRLHRDTNTQAGGDWATRGGLNSHCTDELGTDLLHHCPGLGSGDRVEDLVGGVGPHVRPGSFRLSIHARHRR
jgi:hypothetical protein